MAADRFNQRKLLKVTQASMGVLATALGILTISGNVRLWHVYVFAFVFGAAAALDAPVRQTFVGELMGDEHLPNAVALNSTSFFAGQMIGPAVAGLVIAKIGTGWAFLLKGLSFSPCICCAFKSSGQTRELSAERVASSKDSVSYGLDRTSDQSWLCSF
ncbi:MAG: MFS transporter [Terriglobales bacterium]